MPRIKPGVRRPTDNPEEMKEQPLEQHLVEMYAAMSQEVSRLVPLVTVEEENTNTVAQQAIYLATQKGMLEVMERIVREREHVLLSSQRALKEKLLAPVGPLKRDPTSLGLVFRYLEFRAAVDVIDGDVYVSGLVAIVRVCKEWRAALSDNGCEPLKLKANFNPDLENIMSDQPPCFLPGAANCAGPESVPYRRLACHIGSLVHYPTYFSVSNFQRFLGRFSGLQSMIFQHVTLCFEPLDAIRGTLTLRELSLALDHYAVSSRVPVIETDKWLNRILSYVATMPELRSFKLLLSHWIPIHLFDFSLLHKAKNLTNFCLSITGELSSTQIRDLQTLPHQVALPAAVVTGSTLATRLLEVPTGESVPELWKSLAVGDAEKWLCIGEELGSRLAPLQLDRLRVDVLNLPFEFQYLPSLISLVSLDVRGVVVEQDDDDDDDDEMEDDSGLRAFVAAVRHLKQLQSLRLDDCALSSDDMATILPSFRQLRALRLIRCSYVDTLAFLAAPALGASLHTLVLDDCATYNSTHVKSLYGLTHLQHLLVSLPVDDPFAFVVNMQPWIALHSCSRGAGCLLPVLPSLTLTMVGMSMFREFYRREILEAELAKMRDQSHRCQVIDLTLQDAMVDVDVDVLQVEPSQSLTAVAVDLIVDFMAGVDWIDPERVD